MEKTPENCQKQVIMVVDDNADLAYMTSALVEIWGYKTCVSIDPKTAIALASVENPAVFVLDINMPQMDGYELGAALKKDHPKAAFVGNSALPRSQKREAEVGFSFDYFIQKPNGFRQLEDLLEAITRGGT